MKPQQHTRNKSSNILIFFGKLSMCIKIARAVEAHYNIWFLVGRLSVNICWRRSLRGWGWVGFEWSYGGKKAHMVSKTPACC